MCITLRTTYTDCWGQYTHILLCPTQANRFQILGSEKLQAAVLANSCTDAKHAHINLEHNGCLCKIQPQDDTIELFCERLWGGDFYDTLSVGEEENMVEWYRREWKNCTDLSILQRNGDRELGDQDRMIITSRDWYPGEWTGAACAVDWRNTDWVTLAEKGRQEIMKTRSQDEIRYFMALVEGWRKEGRMGYRRMGSQRGIGEGVQKMILEPSDNQPTIDDPMESGAEPREANIGDPMEVIAGPKQPTIDDLLAEHRRFLNEKGTLKPAKKPVAPPNINAHRIIPIPSTAPTWKLAKAHGDVVKRLSKAHKVALKELCHALERLAETRALAVQATIHEAELQARADEYDRGAGLLAVHPLELLHARRKAASAVRKEATARAEVGEKEAEGRKLQAELETLVGQNEFKGASKSATLDGLQFPEMESSAFSWEKATTGNTVEQDEYSGNEGGLEQEERMESRPHRTPRSPQPYQSALALAKKSEEDATTTHGAKGISEQRRLELHDQRIYLQREGKKLMEAGFKGTREELRKMLMAQKNAEEKRKKKKMKKILQKERKLSKAKADAQQEAQSHGLNETLMSHLDNTKELQNYDSGADLEQTVENMEMELYDDKNVDEKAEQLGDGPLAVRKDAERNIWEGGPDDSVTEVKKKTKTRHHRLYRPSFKERMAKNRAKAEAAKEAQLQELNETPVEVTSMSEDHLDNTADLQDNESDGDMQQSAENMEIETYYDTDVDVKKERGGNDPNRRSTTRGASSNFSRNASGGAMTLNSSFTSANSIYHGDQRQQTQGGQQGAYSNNSNGKRGFDSGEVIDLTSD